jgi:hypothetical protein
MGTGDLPSKTGRRHLRTLFRTAVVSAIIALSNGGAHAQPSIDEALPEVLQAEGYTAAEYELLMEWQEASHVIPVSIVSGFHLAAKSGGTAFDVYFDSNGTKLDSTALSNLGIKAKSWAPSYRSALTEVSARKTKKMAQAPAPKSASANMSPSDMVVLSSIDMAAVGREDAADRENGKGAVRMGVFQDLAEPVSIQNGVASLGAWDTVDGGHMWAIGIYSPDAIGQRVHFSAIDLPSGAYVVIYDAMEPQEVYGPFNRPSAGLTELWAPTCFADTIVIECFVPAGAALAEVSLSIDRIVHQYKSLDEVGPKEGTCNNDVTCFPDWAAEASGVGGVGFIGGNGSLFCTGGLLADEDTSTDIPYFLSANHCQFASQSGAASIEVYWFFQTSVCDGIPPNPATVPRTSGAQFLATSNVSSGTDFVLVQLNGDPPDGVAFNGWSASPQSLETPTTGIHHPDGAFKRISFGDVTDVRNGGSTQPANRFYESTWHEIPENPGEVAVTEPGSSGSPLFNESTHEVIGQLWGGPSACGVEPNKLRDYYGRFDVTFPVIEQFLGQDVFEGPEDINNDQSVDAVDVQLVINDALNIPTGFDSDVNDDNAVDAIDIQLVINAALGI